MDCSLPGSSVHGILQARILEWVAISFTISSGRGQLMQCQKLQSRQLAVVVVEAESVGSGQWLEHVLDGGSLDLTSQVSYSTLGSLSEL